MNALKLLTTKQVAEQLQVSMSTVRNWRKQRKGPRAIVLGAGTIRYSEEELHEYIASKIGQEQEVEYGK